MKFTVEVDALGALLNRACEVVAKKTTLAILENLLLKADNAGLSVTATDLDRWFTECIPACVSAPGSITVPAKMLKDIVRRLPAGGQMEA
jgi:DNA polymerase-3 subunit beta